MILRGDSEKYKYLSENETKFEAILTHWSVAQAGLNEQISLDCPFICILCFQSNPNCIEEAVFQTQPVAGVIGTPILLNNLLLLHHKSLQAHRHTGTSLMIIK